MSTVENPRDIALSERPALALKWVLARSRPQFHYAALVLFLAFLNVAVVQLLLFAFNAFGAGYVIDYQLLGHFVGPLGIGALAAGQVRWRIPDDRAWRPWLVAAIFGGTSVTVFLLLLGGWAWALVGFAAGAILFMFLHWLEEIAARQAASSDPS